MEKLILVAAISATLSTTVILLMVKFRVFSRYEQYREASWPKVCYLCVGFWFCLVISEGLTFVYGAELNSFEILVSALCGTGLVRKLTSDVTV